MSKFTRREILIKTAQISALGAVSSLFACIPKSCQNKQEEQTNTHTQYQDSCPGSELLTQDDKEARARLKYVDQTPISSRNCQNCKIYINPAKNDFCGACPILPGPVHPNGYCMSWIARM